ncbi:metal-dependent hydrolase [Methylovulum miyakonense]|uniref:metal-dependent hydrolase n=1 Tax=Methylovulum miyakonense TaxID=645578 RepID=UPI00035EF695|nr:metal-dependent hydrolase [Methylovulum miyakonense]
MANFKTHVAVAVAASTAAAGFAADLKLITADQTVWLVLLGTIGGMLPDIDADNSKPIRLLFNVLAIISAITAAKAFYGRHESYWVLGVAAVAYLMVRYGVFGLFNRFTEHRGVFHSLLAAVFFGLLATCISFYILHWTIIQAWLDGFFISLGFVVHLLLDELFSVDLSNKRMKKSFGTALKLFHYQNFTASALLLTATLALAMLAPSTVPVRQAMGFIHWTVVKSGEG